MFRRISVRGAVAGLFGAGLLAAVLIQPSPASSPHFTEPIVADEPPKEDLDAVRVTAKSFAEAFRKGDAKALAAHWTENGEYISDDGESMRGRAAIEKDYAEAFAKRKGTVNAEIEVDSIRF